MAAERVAVSAVAPFTEPVSNPAAEMVASTVYSIVAAATRAELGVVTNVETRKRPAESTAPSRVMNVACEPLAYPRKTAE